MTAADPSPAGLMVCLAGEFTVLRDSAELPAGGNGSRKARQLLKPLASTGAIHTRRPGHRDTVHHLFEARQ